VLILRSKEEKFREKEIQRRTNHKTEGGRGAVMRNVKIPKKWKI
jgi:hypothetical protein